MESSFEHVQRFLHLLIADNQRHQQPDCVAIRTSRKYNHTVFVAVLRNLLSILRGGLSCLAGLHQFESLHGTQTANIADLGPAALPPVRAFLKLAAQLVGPLLQVLLFQRVAYAQRGWPAARMAGRRPAEAGWAGSGR